MSDVLFCENCISCSCCWEFAKMKKWLKTDSHPWTIGGNGLILGLLGEMVSSPPQCQNSTVYTKRHLVYLPRNLHLASSSLINLPYLVHPFKNEIPIYNILYWRIWKYIVVFNLLLPFEIESIGITEKWRSPIDV